MFPPPLRCLKREQDVAFLPCQMHHIRTGDGTEGRVCHDVLFREERKVVACGQVSLLDSVVVGVYGLQRLGHIGAEHNVLFADILYVRELVVDIGERGLVLCREA